MTTRSLTALALALAAASATPAGAAGLPVALPGVIYRGDTRAGLAPTTHGDRYQLWRLGRLQAGQVVRLRFADRAHNAVCLLPTGTAVGGQVRCPLWSAVPVDRAGGVQVRLVAPRAGRWVLAVFGYAKPGPYVLRRLPEVSGPPGIDPSGP